MKIPKWVWIAGGAAGVGALLLASGDGDGPQRTGAPKGPIRVNGGEGPQRTSGGPEGTSTYGPDGPPAIGPSGAVEGQTTIVYAQTNNAGVVGGLIPFTAKDVPSISVPDFGGILGSIPSSVIEGTYGMVRQATAEKLYPDSFTEPDGQLSEITAVSLDDGGAADMEVVIDVYASEGMGGAWYKCRRLTFESVVDTSRMFNESSAVVSDPLPPGQKKLRSCHYSSRDYAKAGLSLDVVPRPEAPGEIVLYAVMSRDAGRLRLGLYLWLPPRLGQHKAVVNWSIARD